jgi:ABC-type nitrate/sulfonate/bicarbonate transport system substrate-binding protein
MREGPFIMQAQSLGLIWFVPPPLAILAEDRGGYEPRGLTVSGVVTRSSDQQFEALVRGSADAVITAMDNVIGWNRRGVVDDLAIVAQMERTTVLSLVARPGIERIDQLAGGDMLVDSAENGFVVALRAMLNDSGIGPGRYRLSAVGGVRERLEALLAGRGDATLLGPPFDASAFANGFKLLGYVNQVYPDFPGQGLVARRSVVTHKLAALSSWLESLHEAGIWAHEHEAAAFAQIAKRGFPEPAARAMLAGILTGFEVSRPGVDLLMHQRRILGLPGAGADYKALVDRRLLDSAAFGTKGRT